MVARIRLVEGMSSQAVGLSCPGAAALQHPVSHVVGMRAEEQMLRPNAQRDIAVVKHVQPIRDRARGQDVANPVGTDLLTI